MKKGSRSRGPSKESLRAIPEVDLSRLRRGKRGKYAHLSIGCDVHAVVIDEDVWAHFGSARAINEALRAVVELEGQTNPKKKASRGKARRAA
jgi:hypothetical protein